MIKNLWLGLLLGLAWGAPVWAADKKDDIGGVYETKGDPKVVSGGVIYGGIVDIVIGDVTIAARRRDIRELAVFKDYLDVNKAAERILINPNRAAAFDPRFVDHLIMLLQSFSKLPDYSDDWDEELAPLKAYLNSKAANLLLKGVAGPVEKVINGADPEIINKFAKLKGRVFDEEQIEVEADDYVKELRTEPAFLADPVFIAKCRQDFIDEFTDRLKFALTAISSSVHDFNQYSLDQLRELFLITINLRLDYSIRKDIKDAFFAKKNVEYEKLESLIGGVSLSDNQKRLIEGIKYKWLENGPLVWVTPEEKDFLPVEILHILEKRGFLAKGIVLKILQSQVALEHDDGDLEVDFDEHDDVD